MNNVPPKTILYAEDDENDALLVRLAFEKAGIPNPFFVVPDGRKAIEYLEGAGEYADRQKFPLPGFILLDLNMPGMSGLEVLKWIRKTPMLSALPVVVLTSSNQDTDMHRSYIQGANGYLVKPGNIQELIPMAKAIHDYWLVYNRGPGWVQLPGSGSVL